MSKCSNAVTLHKSEFCTNIGGIDYQVLVDLKTLQGNNEPYFNATEIIKQYNETNFNMGISHNKKRLADWTRSKRFKEIINIWECDFNTPKSKLIYKVRVGSIYESWIHKELFLSLMIWLDAKHEMTVTRFVDKVVRNIDVAVIERTVSKQLSKPMTDQVKLLQEKLFEENSGAAPHIYTTINRQIHRAATGRPTPKGGDDLDTLTKEESNTLSELRDNVEYMIQYMLKDGYTGRETKDAISDFLKGITAENKRYAKARQTVVLDDDVQAYFDEILTQPPRVFEDE